MGKLCRVGVVNGWLRSEETPLGGLSETKRFAGWEWCPEAELHAPINDVKILISFGNLPFATADWGGRVNGHRSVVASLREADVSDRIRQAGTAHDLNGRCWALGMPRYRSRHPPVRPWAANDIVTSNSRNQSKYRASL